MIAALLVLVAGTGGAVALRRRRARRLPAQALIVSPRRSTVVAEDGAVRSLQSAELTIPSEALERLWSPASLENLGRTYWAFLSKVTLGFVRVVYGDNERRVVFLARPLTLLRFSAPEYLIEPSHGSVRWRIRDGLLVARAGRGSGYLALDVRILPTEGDLVTLRIEVEVANFYPAIAAGFSLPAYMSTQSFVHVLVTHAFLRSLATLELEQSRIGALAPESPEKKAA